MEFTFTKRRHHCRRCGKLFCWKCTESRVVIVDSGKKKAHRVCDDCQSNLIANMKWKGKRALPCGGWWKGTWDHGKQFGPGTGQETLPCSSTYEGKYVGSLWSGKGKYVYKP